MATSEVESGMREMREMMGYVALQVEVVGAGRVHRGAGPATA